MEGALREIVKRMEVEHKKKCLNDLKTDERDDSQVMNTFLYVALGRYIELLATTSLYLP